MTLLYSSPLFLQHETGRHPECPARLTAILGRLHTSGLISQCHEESFQPLREDAVAQVHDRRVVAIARQVANNGGGYIDADTVLSPMSFTAALAAAGACVSAVDAVLTKRDSNALCLVRPPGHHATPSTSMGFCLFNNVALAAQHARVAHGVNRVLIVDWDVHHGNGTQDVFFADPDILFLSIHRYGHGFYPGTGAADETGTGAGLGCTVNVPVRYGTTRADYRAMYRNAIEDAGDRIKPELVLISAGFDAHARDPIGSLDLESDDFGLLTRMLLDVAGVHAHNRVVSCLEGGYNLDALAEGVQIHLEELIADSHRAGF